MLKVTVNDLGNTAILHCVGRIVRGEETALLCPAVRLVGRDVFLDLSQVEAIDAAGIGALVALQAAGVFVKIVNPAKAVREVLKLTGVESIFHIEDETGVAVDRAVASASPFSALAATPA